MTRIGRAWAGRLRWIASTRTEERAHRAFAWEHPISIAIAAVAVVMLTLELAEIAARWDEARPSLGGDFLGIIEGTRRWLAGGPFYLPEQLAGPYGWPGRWMLYPPPMLLLFVPFTVLPAVLWWALPIGATAWAIARHRPRPLALAVMALCLANPTTLSMMYWGNPGLYMIAALALATHYGWPGVFVLMKPTLAPFAMFGIWRRRWWVGLVILVLMSLPFLPLWVEYIDVVRNLRPPGGIAYSIPQVPAMLLPIAAWLGRST